MPVGVMLAQTSSPELTEYMAYDRIDPFGEARSDLRAGIVASTVANFGGRDLKKPLGPVDFMPFVKPRGPIKLKNVREHAKLLARSLFGDVTAKNKERKKA